MYCRKCGSKIPDDSDFCFRCGSPTAGVTQATPPQEGPQNPLASRPAPRKSRKILWLAVGLPAAAIVLVVFILVFLPMIQTANDYSYAQELLVRGEYNRAEKAFLALGDYRDSVQMALEVQYQKGWYLLEIEQYDDAAELFSSLGDYSDASTMVLESQYRKGVAMLANEEYDDALAIFITLGDYSESVSQCHEAVYQKGLIKVAAAENAAGYMEAIQILYPIFDYKDTQNQIRQCILLMSCHFLAGGKSATYGIQADGTVVAVGDNTYGQADVSEWTDIISVSAGWFSAVGLKRDGTVVATGKNFYGQNDVSDWSDIVAVSASPYHTVGLRGDGTVVAAGQNTYGQCDVSDWTGIVAIAAGYEFTVGLKWDGTVLVKGANGYGQCDVAGWNDIVAVAANENTTYGLKSDGTVIAAGRLNELVHNWSNIVAISAQGWHVVGLKEDGRVISGFPDPPAILQVGDLNTDSWREVVTVVAGYEDTLGLTASGDVLAVSEDSAGPCDLSSWSGKITADVPV